MTDELEVEQETLSPDGDATTETVEGNDELVKAKEIASNQKIRAEKAEAELKRLKAEAEAKKPKETETPKNSEYSLQDIRALQDVHDDNVQDVVEFARFKKISIPEARKHPTVQTILREAEEQRKTALASNTGPVKRGASQSTDESILEKYSNGNLPEDSKEMDRLAEARMNQKLKNRNLKS